MTIRNSCKDYPETTRRILADPPVEALERARKARLAEGDLPDPADEADHGLDPASRNRLAYMTGLAVGIDAALAVMLGNAGR